MMASSESSAERRLQRISQRVDEMLLDMRARGTSPPAEATPESIEPAFGPLYETAAVLAAFDPAQPAFSKGSGDENELRRLLADSMAVAAPAGDRKQSLRALTPEVRSAVLRQMRTRGHLSRMLARVALFGREQGRPDDDPLQAALNAYLQGIALPVPKQTLEQLTAGYQVCQWLRQAGFPGLPDEAEFRRRADWLSLLRTFEHLVGTHFRGRVKELQQLRDYVGVLPPATLGGKVNRFLAKVLSLHEKPPLLIYGPGGVGKSTLLSYFLLEHAKAAEESRFPFIYLDFDRTDVDPGAPISLLLESLRQIGIEYPESRQGCERIAGDWRIQIERMQASSHMQSSVADLAGPQARLLQRAVADFSSLITTVGAADVPVVLILDTFEEVQVRSEDQVQAIWDLLNDIQRGTPRLRVVIAGRAELPAHLPTQKLPLEDLDEAAATGYLQVRGITDETIARRIVQQVGRTPLTLQLAADLYAREGATARGELNVITSETRFLLFSAKLTQGQIQRHLYKRVLGHIKNEDVKKLAHPGLVLRRITPELILEVLAGPCDLTGVKNLAQATALFDQLRSEVSLVSADGSGALRHRPDLRRLMVDLLREDEPRKVATIHRGAVAYYEKQPAEPVGRAEEIYHRLCLNEDSATIDARWLPQVETFLPSALVEFTGARRAFLASRLHLEVDAETRLLADLEDWEKLTERKVRNRLAAEDYQGALTELSARKDRTPSSELFSLEAIALAKLRRWSESLAVLRQGQEQASAATVPDWALSVALASQTAELVLTGHLIVEAPTVADSLRTLREGASPGAPRLRLLAQEIALRAMNTPAEATSSMSSPRAELRAEFDAAADEELQKDPQLPLWIQLVLEPEDASRLARLLRLTGLPAGDRSSLIQLSHELESVQPARNSELRSTRRGGGGSGLESLRPAGTRRGGSPALESVGLESVPPQDIRAVLEMAKYRINAVVELATGNSGTALAEAAQDLSSWLEALGGSVSANTMNAFNRVAQTALGIDVSGPAANEPPPATRLASSGRTLSGPKLRQVMEAIEASFSMDELRMVMEFRLQRSLESLVNFNQPFSQVLFDVIGAANREAWLPSLVTHLSEERPGNPALNAAVEELGGAPAIVFQPRAEKFGGPVLGDFLTRVKSQICRVEVAGGFAATGFLVGSDLVLAAVGQNNDLGTEPFASPDVQVRFDLRLDKEGNILSPGVTFHARRGPPVALGVLGTENGLRFGYVLLGISDSPGIQPISQIDSKSPQRGWISLSPALSNPWQLNAPVALLGYLRRGPLRFSLRRLFSVSRPDGVFSYDDAMDEEPDDLPGGAVFDSALNLVGLDLGPGPGLFLCCASIDAIIRDLRAKGLDHLLRASDKAMP